MNHSHLNNPVVELFPLGKVVATQGVMAALDGLRMIQLLRKHRSGSWGAMDLEDWEANNDAVKFGNRILSAYPIDPDKPCKGYGDNTVWIITEADRSATTFLLPSEY